MSTLKFIRFLVCALILLWASAITRSEVTLRGVATEGVDCRGLGSWTDDSKSNAVLDFSAFGIVGDAEVKYIEACDSVIMELLPDCRCDFLIRGDSCRLLHVEGRTWRADGAIAIGSSGVCGVSADISRFLSEKYSFEGLVRQTVTAGATAIFACGDTLGGLSVFRIGIDGIARPADGRPAAPVSVNRTYLFQKQSALPVAIVTEYDGNIVSSYVFKPSENAGETLRQQIAHTNQALPLRHLRADNLRPSVGVDRLQPLTEAHRQGCSIVLSGADLSVGFDDSENFTVQVVLCDVAGRMIPASSASEAGVWFKGLPPGYYVLGLTANDRWSGYKFQIPVE